jgi:lipid-A-disaccharide synthase
VKYYLIAGEASGDLHGSNLMKGILKSDPDAEFRFFGGDKMSQVGGHLVRHYQDMAFMGLIEVIVNFRSIFKNIRFCRNDIVAYNPDVVILIDYPGFNLRIARFAKKAGYRVFYYISPKVWARNESRVKQLKAYVDRLFVIFPFEVPYFRKFDMDVDFLGNPTLDAVEQKVEGVEKRPEFLQKNNLSEKKIVALLAGSRKHEIKHCLPEMIKASYDFPDYQFVIAAAPSISPDYYVPFIENTPVKIVLDQTYQLLWHAEAAVVTSGTATLETALLDVPEVVIYKFNEITINIARFFVHIKYFSLVNLIMDREVVKELLQYNLSRDIVAELKKLLYDEVYRKRMLDSFARMKDMLGGRGASERVANQMVMHLEGYKETKSKAHA